MLKQFEGLSTPLVADACVRLGVGARVAPVGVAAGSSGRVVRATGTGGGGGGCFRCGTTGAWTCSWRRTGRRGTGTCW